MHSSDLNLLPVAHALLTEQSVTRAAARLHLSVPATSRALDRCRTTFGDPLLVRSGRGLQITPRGAALLSDIEAALDAIDRAMRAPHQFDPAQLRCTFVVRTNEVILAVVAGAWLQVIAEDAPDVHLRFEAETPDDLAALRRGDVSLVVGSYSGLTNDLHRQTLVDEQLVGVLRQGHPSTSSRMTPKRFASLGHVVTSRRGIGRGPVDDLLERYGLQRSISAIVPSFAAAIGMCLTSDLTTLAPRRLLDVLGGQNTMHTFDVPVPLPSVEVDAIWHARHHRDPPHLWLRSTLERAVADATGLRTSRIT